jgi:hypothetical protein
MKNNPYLFGELSFNAINNFDTLENIITKYNNFVNHSIEVINKLNNNNNNNNWLECPEYNINVNNNRNHEYCCHCKKNKDILCVTITETFLNVGYSIFEWLNDGIVMYFTNERPEHMTIDSCICDDCIFELLYDGTLQFDYDHPWYNYQEPPTLEDAMGPHYINGQFDLSKYKSTPYDYKKRLFRFGIDNNGDYNYIIQNELYNYPVISKSNIDKIKMNPDLFGEFSRKVYINLV